MTIYVDNYQGVWKSPRGRYIMSHLLSDESIEELHEFAEALGLKREWFQDGSAPHYDVSQSKRRQALEIGAVSLPIKLNNRFNPKWREVYHKARSLK